MVALVSSNCFGRHLNFFHPIRHRQALTPDRHDFSYADSWAVIGPQADPSLIENEPILSPIHRGGAAIDAANGENAKNGNTEAVGIFKASLHREVSEEQLASP